jgi:hypothetical protein
MLFCPIQCKIPFLTSIISSEANPWVWQWIDSAASLHVASIRANIELFYTAPISGLIHFVLHLNLEITLTRSALSFGGQAFNQFVYIHLKSHILFSYWMGEK